MRWSLVFRLQVFFCRLQPAVARISGPILVSQSFTQIFGGHVAISTSTGLLPDVSWQLCTSQYYSQLYKYRCNSLYLTYCPSPDI